MLQVFVGLGCCDFCGLAWFSLGTFVACLWCSGLLRCLCVLLYGSVVVWCLVWIWWGFGFLVFGGWLAVGLVLGGGVT